MSRPLVNMYFDIDVAKDVGSDPAIIFQNIVFWVAKNKANNKHFYEGKYWTYNSRKAFQELFPWMTTQNIRTYLKNLEAKGYIETGNFNKKGYDKTLWYTICENQQTHLLELTNRSDKTNKPIPDNKPDNKPYILDEKTNLVLETIKTQAGLSILPGTEAQQVSQAILIRKRFENALGEDCLPETLTEAIAVCCRRMKEDDFLKGRFADLKLFYSKIPLYSPLFKVKKEVYL